MMNTEKIYRPRETDPDKIEWEITSEASTNATTDNNPGPGRLLGQFYSSLGLKVEDGIGRIAVRMGRGPRTTAIRIRKEHDLARTRSILLSDKDERRVRKYSQRLARYAWYVRGTQSLRNNGGCLFCSIT